jgi:dolichol-phosphate mannosyltransferase
MTTMAADNIDEISKAEDATRTSVTVIVPTYHEVASIPHLVARLQSVRTAANLDLELIMMDDDSRDGSAELVDSLALPWVRMVTRKTNRGLSYAVLDGLRLAQREFVVVMDADLSHPPEKIPELLTAIRNGADVAVGSRFAEGGSTADDWGLFRWLNSRVATLLAFGLTTVSDPMSGFFAMRRSTFWPAAISTRWVIKFFWNASSNAAAGWSPTFPFTSTIDAMARASCRFQSSCDT